MKTFLSTLLFLLIWTSASAQEVFLINGIENHPIREGVANLKSPDHKSIQVDCASFLFGITVEDQNRKDFLYLYESECYDIIETLFDYQQAQQPACLEVNFIEKDWQLWKSDGDCQ